MSIFKFSCPVCKQRIEIGSEFQDRRVDCPSCKATLAVPAAPENESEIPVAELVTAPASVKPSPAPVQVLKKNPPSPAAVKPGPAPSPKSAAATDPAPAKVTPAFPSPATDDPKPDTIKQALPTPTEKAEQISELRVAVMTPEVKLQIVQGVRERIANKSHWLPGKKSAGDYNYAARLEGDKVVPLTAIDASATHFSLFGAVLLEFHRRNIARVTTGRTEFLDEELTQAIQHVLGKDKDGSPVSEADRDALTHEQCLTALDFLEKRLKKEAEKAHEEQTRRKIDKVLLADLVEKLEKKAPIRAEEVACALFYELEELKGRLAELEQSTPSKK